MNSQAPETRSAAIAAHIPDALVLDQEPLDPKGSGCPFSRVAALHDGPPAVFMPPSPMRPRGAWLLSRAEDARHVFQQTDIFSSRDMTGFAQLVGESWPLIPLELDPPEHGKFRTILSGMFSPSYTAAMEPGIRARAAGLIDGIVKRGECEFISEFARLFPVKVFMQMMGLPEEDFDLLCDWEFALLHSGTMAERVRGAQGFAQYLRDLIAQRRRAPRDDLASLVLRGEVDGRALSDDEVLGMYYLLVTAGLDTVAASLGLHFRHLALNPQDQSRLRANPELTRTAVEELLRRYSIVSTSRTVTRDVEIAGVVMKAGDRVSLATSAANLDPLKFDDPFAVDLQRSPNTHLAFASGPHRCLGSHLARREIVAAIEEWLKRVPPFTLKPGAEAPILGGPLINVAALPLVWSVA